MESTPQRAEGTGKISLVRKLAEVMGEVTHVPKDGSNTFHNYKYATEAAIVASVRKAMAARQLLLVPSVLKQEWTRIPRKQGGEDRLCTLTVRFTLHDGESGEEMSFEVLGEGQDTGDKATYKAMTGAVKYALLKLFLIPTGDDPEHEDGTPTARPGKARSADTGPRGEQGQSAKGSEGNGAAGSPPKRPMDPATVHGVVVAFGPHKGKTASELGDDELNGTIDLAHAKLMEEPKAKWAKAMRENLAMLEAEASLRVKVPPVSESANG